MDQNGYLCVAPKNALAWIEVNTHAIRRNVSALRTWLGPRTAVMAVVKANAYGHGLTESARAALAGGASGLGVARLDEALALRQAGIAAQVLVLGAGHPDQAEAVVGSDVAQTVSDTDTTEALAAAGQRRKATARVHVKVDTGMGRVGMPVHEVGPFCKRLATMSGVALQGIATHFPWGLPAHMHRVPPQLAEFERAIGLARAQARGPCVRHAANSVITFACRQAHYDMVRVGLIIYGIPPGAADPPFALAPALALKARITQVRTMRRGQTISYGGTHTVAAPSRIAVVPVGYADGYSRRLSNKSHVLVAGRRCPVVGAICMDQMLVDVTGVAEARVGCRVVLIGRDGEQEITVAELADRSGGIPHEVVSGLSQRLVRVAVRPGNPDPHGPQPDD